jgi:ABC-type multidrug transport system fused ATPase/permease subunit
MTEIDKNGKNNLAHLINNHCEGAKNLGSFIIASSISTISTMSFGLTIAFIYCWQITLVALFLIPLSLIAGKLQQRFMSGLG